MSENFTWMGIYRELAIALLDWQDRQTELIAFLNDLHKQGYVITSLQDKNKDGGRFLLEEIDPFTFFGVFNRGIKNENRLAILASIKNHFGLEEPLPSDFDGIPVIHNQTSWFFQDHASRRPDDIPRLWRVFKTALQDEPLKNTEFLRELDEAWSVPYVNVNLTMGLFWIRPDTFLSLDSRNREYLGIELPAGGLNSNYYVGVLEEFSSGAKSFPEISLAAWRASTGKPIVKEVTLSEEKGVSYWLVGAYWDDRDPPDQTQRFLDDGIWENGYSDRYIDEVKAMQVNDKIAIKATTTQRMNLPFDAQGRTVSRMVIKAIGTIVANRDDGQSIEVEWDPDFQPKSWYFYTGRNTVWRLQTHPSYKMRENSRRLIEFVWGGQEQDYAWFCQEWWGHGEETNPSIDDPLERSARPYSIEDVAAEGAFLEEHELHRIMDRLRAKKTLVLQGAPGVGKTFIARKIAYALMEEVDPERLEMVQFHQSYSYDDFVRGYRPVSEAGRFDLQNGIFYEFCRKAEQDPERKYVFIIDEINRGNLSLIFGELLMLIEADKRGKEFAVPLVYRIEGEPRFHIPANLYLIGLMNIADRSLAMVDYALRRRFAFVTLHSQYEGAQFQQWLLDRSMSKELVDMIVARMSALNREIKDDPLLGENYQIGHSYFCPKGSDFSGLSSSWYEGIVETEIVPLLKEYWFDNRQKAEEAARRLLA